VSEPAPVRVYLATPSSLQEPDRRAWALALLPADERERIRRFRSERDRDVALASRVLQRRALSATSGGAVPPDAWRFDSAPHVRPRIVGPTGFGALSWSASNAVGLAACAVTLGGAVGIDVEPARDEAPMDVVEAYFAARERTSLGGLTGSARARHFVEIWTLKEAYGKARGQGLALPLASLAFDPTTRPPGFRVGPPVVDDAARWHLLQWWVGDGHCLALCAAREGATPPVVSVVWDALA